MKAKLKALVVSILTFEAKLLLKKHKPFIVAITGSVGKTSTKDAIYSAIRHKTYARKNQKSYNSEIGVPLTVLGLENGWSNPFVWLRNIVDGALKVIFNKDYPDILILEAGVDRPGDMKNLVSWVKPDLVVLTRLPDVPVHVEFFNSPEDVISEKMVLVNALKDDGVLVYNHDDERVRKEAEGIRQKSFGYSRYSQSHFTLSGDEVIFEGRRPVGTKAKLTHIGEQVEIQINGSVGVQHAYSYAAACAVGHVLGVSMADCAQGLIEAVPPPGRMRLINGIHNSLIIDDTYNSSPVAATRALESLAELTTYGQRKIVVLGDMLELGRFSTREHEKLGEYAAKVATILVTVGVRSRKIAEGALENGLSEKHIYQYETIEDAMKEVPQMIKDGDAILVKGSQSVRAEKLVEALMENPENAKYQLVRQDPMWSKK